MGISDRKQRDKDKVRCAILEASWNLAKNEGWQELSIRKIADAIEYSVPVIYRHFENKQAILSEFVRQGFELLNRELVRAKEQTTGPEEQLKALAFAYWDFAFNNKEHYQLMFGLNMPCCKENFPNSSDFTVIGDTIRELIVTRKSNADPKLKFHVFWSTLHGLVSIHMVNDDHERLAVLVLRDFVEGFIANMQRIEQST